MIQTIEDVIDERGQVQLTESVRIQKPAKKSLAEDWRRPHEEQAWAHLRLRHDLPHFLDARTRRADLLALIERKSPEPEVREKAETLGARLGTNYRFGA